MATRTFEAYFDVVGTPAVRVLEFHHRERIGFSAEADVDVHLESYVDPEELIGKGALLSYGFEGETAHVFRGAVESVTVMATAADGPSPEQHYRFHVVTPLALMDGVQANLIHQDLDVKEIVTKTLQRYGIDTDLQKWTTSGSFPKREFCVQYDESPFAFVKRLCEEEGIYFFTEPQGDDGKNVVIFADDSTSAPPIEGDAEVPFRVRGGLEQRADAVTEIELRRRVVPGKIILRDYDFKKPTLDLTCDASSDADTDLELYDFPGRYVEPSQGKRLAKVRLEAEQAERRTLRIEADCTRIRAGRQMSIAESPDADGKYFITAVEHVYRHASKHGVEGVGGFSDGGEMYHAVATLLPAEAHYRLPLVTPKPVIEGPQTATVVAPAGSPDQEIHTDEHGRAKVLLRWDLRGLNDDKASCWMRVGQLQTSGSMYLPRIGWEVVIQFLEGDPDRPVVTGKLYNGQLMPPYALPEGRTRTAIQSLSTPGGGGMNEVRFEDKSGSEEISIKAQYDKSIVAANNKTKNVGNNEKQFVGVDSSTKVGANQKLQISKGYQRTIGADQSLTVGANRTLEVNAVAGLTVGGSSKTTIGANHFEMDGNPLEGLISLVAEKVLDKIAHAAIHKAQAVAGAAIAKVQQALGPVAQVAQQAEQMSAGVQAVANGNLGAAAGVLGAAAGLPGAGAVAQSMGSGGGDAAGGHGGGEAGGGHAGGGEHAAAGEHGGGGEHGAGGEHGGGGHGEHGHSEGVKPGGHMPAGALNAAHTLGDALLGSAMGKIAEKGVSKVAKALEGGEGGGGGGGGGESGANAEGPDGTVAGLAKTDREKGPGHSIQKIDGNLSETVGALKLVAAANTIMTNIAGSATETVGAAKVEIVLGNYSEAYAATKSETEIGLVSIVKGDETESAGAMKTEMVGGAVAEKIAGNHTVVAGAMATFIGAFHKVDAKGKITFKCGASSVVVDGSGVTITSPAVQIMAAKIEIPKATTEA